MANSPLENYPQLISLAVHELRTPASIIGGYLRMLQRDPEAQLGERQRKMIDEAAKSCARLVEIVAELSDAAKLDAGLVTLAPRPLDLFPLVAEVAELVHEAKDRDVHLVVTGHRTGAGLTGDATRLRHAFDALFRAILREKAGPATIVAERRLETIDGRPHAVVIVADEASVQAAYERPAGVFDDKRGGLGLALPVARRVVAGHGGSIWSPAPRADLGDAGSDPLARGSVVVALPTS